MKYKQFTVILALLSGIVLGITWTINAQPTQPFVNLNPAQFSPIPGVANGSVDWGDYDNDGDPDLLIAGSAWIAPRITQIWINEAGNFSLSPATLTGIQYGEATWGDYDNDGDLDILITGSLDGSPMNGTTEIWTNQGNGTFTQLLGTAFPDLIYSSVDWGDYDGDGDLDVTLAGDATAGPDQTEIWTNNGGGNFSRLSSTTFPGAFFVRWGNYDNDADLDLLVIGNSGTRLWINQGSGVFNQLPGTTFASSTNGTWGDYDNDGDLDLVLAGQTTQIWKNQGSGVFQAVATLTAASSGDLAWGDYDNDNDLDLLLTGTQNPSPNLEFSTQLWRNNGGDQFTLVTNLAVYYFENGNVAWADYDLDGDLDFTANGFNNNGYLTELWINQGNGQFSQYRAPLLPDVAGGSVDWGDYDNDGDRDLLITGLRESLVNRTPIWTNQGGGSFSQLQGTTMPMLRDGDAKWGDYDNDGDLDFAQTGTVFDPIAPSSDAKVTQIWTNQGGGNFTLLKSVITVRTSIAWVDFDNDGDLDLS
ncbi:MAG: VCBS repeat-containing protein, partial [Anaerolineae bacterium]|nr:VCBS repeat-containing protein [Anaerolineae bacterium]